MSFGAAMTVAVMCIGRAPLARADAVVYPKGAFARPSEEKAIIVWDEAHKTEHLIRALTLKGDADKLGVLVATPTLPTIAKESEELVDRAAEIFIPKLAASDAGVMPNMGEVLKRTQVGAFDAVTLTGGGEHPSGDWLGRNAFTDRPAIDAWEKAYRDKGWVVTAVHAAAQGTGDRKLEIEAMRLSFKTDAPVLPYTEATVDPAEETAYAAKYNNQPRFRGYTYGTRPLDVYVIADRQLQAVDGQTTAGPPVADSMRISQATLRNALGDTTAWGFDPTSRPTWVVTHLSENVWQRATHGDLGFAPYDLPKARPGPGITELDDRPTGPTYPASSMAWMNPDSASGTPASPHKKLLHIGAFALLFLIAGVAGYAVMSEQQRPKPKS